MAEINLTASAKRARLRVERQKERRRQPSLFQEEPIADTDLAYAAGIIDGEGCISIHRRKDRRGFSGHVVVAMCEPQAVTFLHDAFGGSLGMNKIHHPDRPEHRPQNVWSVATQQAAWVCKKILPFLRVKKRQAQNLIKLQNINANIRDQTTAQRRYRSERFGMFPEGRYAIDPTLHARAIALYEEQRRLNQRGRKSHEDIPIIRSTAPPIKTIGSMLVEEGKATEEPADATC